MSESEKFIKHNGHCLNSVGLSYMAYDYNSALLLLDILAREKKIVSGGDVLIKIDDHFEFTYDSWFFEQNNSISNQHNCEKSIKTARTYLKKYPHKPNNYFSLIISQSERNGM